MKRNIILIILLGIACFSYVVGLMLLSSGQYELSVRRSQYKALATSLATAERDTSDNHSVADLLSFAGRTHMTDSKELTSILYVHDNDVAYDFTESDLGKN